MRKNTFSSKLRRDFKKLDCFVISGRAKGGRIR